MSSALALQRAIWSPAAARVGPKRNAAPVRRRPHAHPPPSRSTSITGAGRSAPPTTRPGCTELRDVEIVLRARPLGAEHDGAGLMPPPATARGRCRGRPGLQRRRVLRVDRPSLLTERAAARGLEGQLLRGCGLVRHDDRDRASTHGAVGDTETRDGVIAALERSAAGGRFWFSCCSVPHAAMPRQADVPNAPTEILRIPLLHPCNRRGEVPRCAPYPSVREGATAPSPERRHHAGGNRRRRSRRARDRQRMRRGQPAARPTTRARPARTRRPRDREHDRIACHASRVRSSSAWSFWGR